MSSTDCLKRHPEYFIPDGNIHFLVEKTHFKIHSHFLLRESDVFRDYFPIPGPAQKGTSESNAIVLEDVTADEFSIFLWVFYDPKYSRDTTPENWKIILHLAQKWAFPGVKRLAIEALEKVDIPLVERIGLYQDYHVPGEIINPHYASLCGRARILSLEETERVGMRTTLMIFAVRERLLANQNGVRPLDQLDANIFLKSVNSYFESRKKKANQTKDDKHTANGIGKPETGA